MKKMRLLFVILAVALALALVPSALAGSGEWMIAYTGGSWEVPCGPGGGLAKLTVHAIVPEGFTWVSTTTYIDEFGEYNFGNTSVTPGWVIFDGPAWMMVPPNGSTVWTDQVISPAGVVVSNTSMEASCATGEIRSTNGNIYVGSREPDPATRQYGLVTQQTAVFSQPSLDFPVAKAVLYPGEKWFVTDTIGGEWYKVYLSGAKYVYVPTSAMRLIGADEWYAPQTVTK